MGVVHVAVGVILDDDRNVLVARRPEHAHLGGLWEFPGGKLQAGETVLAALARELREELGIALRRSEPLLEVRHDYGDKEVLLDVHLVTSFSGTPAGLDGQPLAWLGAAQLGDYDFPAANLPIVGAVKRKLKYTE